MHATAIAVKRRRHLLGNPRCCKYHIANLNYLCVLEHMLCVSKPTQRLLDVSNYPPRRKQLGIV
jgi:hypothetical protein